MWLGIFAASQLTLNLLKRLAFRLWDNSFDEHRTEKAYTPVGHEHAT